MFKFSQTEPAKANTYLEPGIYKARPVKFELSKFKGGTEYMATTFETEEGGSFVEKFVLSDAALGRIQYLHFAWVGKLISKDMKTSKEVVDFFDKLFVKGTKKPPVKPMVVGGQIATDGKVYAQLPFSDYVITDENYELGVFEAGSPLYNKWVKKANANSITEGTTSTILNGGNDDDAFGGGSDSAAAAPATEAGDELPW